MKTYTVYIEAKEYYTIEVMAKDEEQAEEYAWRLFPGHNPHYGENNVTEITCNEENPHANH
jgi:hypothetical protein